MSNNIRKKLIEMKDSLTPRDEYHQALKEKFQKKPAEVKKTKGRATRLRSLQKQWQPYQDTIDKYVAKKIKDSGNLPDKIDRIKQTLSRECAHPIDFLQVEEVRREDRTDVYIHCTLCDRKDKVDTKNHHYYGD